MDGVTVFWCAFCVFCGGSRAGLVDKTAYLCRLGWHSHGSQYPRNSFGQTFEFKNSWGPSSKSADSPLILSALCHYTSWLIRSIVTSVFVPITPACGKTLPPLDLAKVPGSKRNFWHTRAATKLSAKDSQITQISHLWQTFCSLSNPWQVFKLCCESRLGASDTHSWAKIYQQLSNQSSTWDHAPHSLAGDVELRAGGFGFNKSQISDKS